MSQNGTGVKFKTPPIAEIAIKVNDVEIISKLIVLFSTSLIIFRYKKSD